MLSNSLCEMAGCMLRVGIVLESFTSSAWIARVLTDIQSSGFAQITLVIHFPSSAQESLPAKHRQRRQTALFQRYEAWDYRRNLADHNALASTDLKPLLHGVPTATVLPPAHGDDPWLQQVSGSNLDVIFCFGAHAAHARLLGAARYGVWSFDPDISREDGAPPIFWQFVNREAIESSLRILIKPGETRVAYRSYAAGDQASLYRTRNPVYWKTATFALRCLRELHQGGEAYVSSLPIEQASPRKRKGRVTHWSMMLFLLRDLNRWLRARFDAIRSPEPPKWCVAVRKRKGERPFSDSSGYQVMSSPADRFYADPFLAEKDGRTFLLFEDFRYSENRAVISCSELDENGNPMVPVEILRRPYHLSYPFIFEDGGTMYMVPETRGNRKIELYRAVEFPWKWQLETVLLDDVDAVDATLYKQDGRWWMFAGISNGLYSTCDELNLFYAPSVQGPWKPHSLNPLLSDVRRARPAGALFQDKGRLIRPSQDCCKAYGYGVVFSEITELSEFSYKEKVVGHINPEDVPHVMYTHTYNRTEHFEVLDRTLPARYTRPR